MGRGKQYYVAGEHFRTQGELESRVKAALNGHPVGVEFEDSFLAAVINEHHPDVRAAGQRSTGRFVYLSYAAQVRRGLPTADRFRGGKIVLGWFEPLCEWRDVTVYPWRRPDARREIKAALREKVAPHLPKPTDADKCADPGCNGSGYLLEYEHIQPTFDQIAERCLELVTIDELTSRFGYSKFTPGTYTLADHIPDDHPAVRCCLDAHRDNAWAWLCPLHHRNVGRAKA